MQVDELQPFDAVMLRAHVYLETLAKVLHLCQSDTNPATIELREKVLVVINEGLKKL